jgi:serine/threonine-protein kinase
MDFGLARDHGDASLTQSNTVVGTPSFMPPEQARGDRGTIDARSDVYALGATLYALLSGRPPLTGTSATEVLMRVLHEEPPPLRKLVPSLPVDVESIAMKCLEKDPARRYASARALADDLARYLQGQPISARPPSRIYRLRLAVRRHRTVAATGLVAAVVAIGMGASLVKARIEARHVAQLAQRFGGAASEIEQRMRLAALMPEHDIGRDRLQLHERLQALAAETAAAGSIAEGPARYALGRGHLALGELAAARSELERAWKLQYRPAETAAALGTVWERLWERDRDESSREGARESSKQAERETRERVAGWLRLARGAPQVDSGLLEARIDYFQERIPQARDEAHAVFDRDPQQWEALLLEGRASSKLGHRLAGDGALAEARAHYARAETALTLAATIARSDPDVQYELCRLYDRILEVQAGRDQVAVEACRRAALVDPSSEAAQGKLAIALNRLVEKVHPPDAAALLDEAQRAAERAVAQAPRFANHYRVLANSLRLRGDFDGACAVIERGLRADPDSKSAEKLLLTEAQIEVARGHALLSRHEDAEGAVKAAQAAIDRARAHARADDFRIQVATTGVRVLAAAAAPPAQRASAIAAARADLARTLAVTREETPALRELAAELEALSR